VCGLESVFLAMRPRVRPRAISAVKSSRNDTYTGLLDEMRYSVRCSQVTRLLLLVSV
jgi:hypothetical protein